MVSYNLKVMGSFQTIGAATEKARLPQLTLVVNWQLWQKRGTMSTTRARQFYTRWSLTKTLGNVV